MAAGIFYLRLDVRLGLVMSACSPPCWRGGCHGAPGHHRLAGLGLGLFAVGWVIQFVGHYYEGRKPAFVDDVMGLLVGPLLWWPNGALRWVCAQKYSTPWNSACSGPVRRRDLRQTA